MRLYADSAALAAYPGGAAVPEADADALLRAASRAVDELLFGIVYATDAEQLPSDPDVAQAMSDATCAIALEAHTTGALAAGATKRWKSVSVGNVSLADAAEGADTVVVLGLPIPAAALLALAGIGCTFTWVRS